MTPLLPRFIASCSMMALITQVAMSKPFFVDLSKEANVSREDDGIAGNGKGGWTDEGINDLYLFPPLPVGETIRNGYAFKLLDPGDGTKPAALMLRTREQDANRPKSVDVAIPNVRGNFIVFIQHAVGGSQTREGEPLALYTVHYADGTTVDVPMLKGTHLRDWWCRQWWDNSGSDAWPVYMGRNVYTMKWHCLIGLWATQWKNTRPEVPISGITFTSLDQGAPVIWAVTLDDSDAHANETVLKKDVWSNPPGAPEGYFEKKLAAERSAIYDAAVADGHIEGVRSVEIICNDLIAVTVDPAITRTAAGSNPATEAAAQKPQTFTITSSDDPAFSRGVNPVKVGRDSYEYWNGDLGRYQQNCLYWHTFYLQLKTPLKSGAHYDVKVAGIDPAMRSTMGVAYHDATTPTRVIKVNQVAYTTRATRRYAYLGWWAADLGPVDYSNLSRFEVIDESTSKVALDGALQDREDKTGNSGEKVREMDLTALTIGQYHIRIPGLGRSASFGVGGKGIRDLYFHTQRAFYHQRCGFALEEPYTKFLKPACHLEVYESGKMVEDKGYKPTPGEAIRTFVGGYHDAADFDCFTYHLRATAQNLDAYESAPAAFKDGDLNIPESGNGIPDILDEADWALRFWREHQSADGGVPKGRCNDQDSRRQNHVQWSSFGIFPPDPTSNFEYAATAASFARLYAKHNAKLAQTYLASAVKAFDWALAQPEDPKDESRGAFMLWAASALYRATGETRFNTLFIERAGSNGFRTHWSLAAWGSMLKWQYVRCEQTGTDKALVEKLKQEIISSANWQVDKQIDAEAYRWGGNSTRGMGWGNGNGGGHYADGQLRAWWLTGEQKYLDTASLNADFQLGCNPLSKTFITGMGARPPLHPQISHFLYEKPGKRGGTVAGITIYGLTDGDPRGWYPTERPRLRRWRDLGNGSAEISSEFTITETIGASAMLYSALFSAESQTP